MICTMLMLVLCADFSPITIAGEVIDDEAGQDTTVNGCHVEVIQACNGESPYTAKPSGAREIDRWYAAPVSEHNLVRARPRISNSDYWHCRCSPGTPVGASGTIRAACVVPAEMGNPDALYPQECRP